MSTLEISVDSMFFVSPTSDIVLSGFIRSGTVSIGDLVRIHSPKDFYEVRVKGVEIDRKIVTNAEKGTTVALLLPEIDLDKLSDGLAEQENSIVPSVFSLTVRDAPKSWWEVWR